MGCFSVILALTDNLTQTKHCFSIVEMHTATRVTGVRGASGCSSLLRPENNIYVVRPIIRSVQNAAAMS